MAGDLQKKPPQWRHYYNKVIEAVTIYIIML